MCPWRLAGRALPPEHGGVEVELTQRARLPLDAKRRAAFSAWPRYIRPDRRPELKDGPPFLCCFCATSALLIITNGGTACYNRGSVVQRKH